MTSSERGPGLNVLGGGGEVGQGPGAKAALTISEPNPDTSGGTPVSWSAQATVMVTGMGSVSIKAYAICSLP